MTTKLIDEIKWSAEGLVPAIVQDAVSKEVLMLAYMNQESLKLSLDSGETWFWSRSRSELWHKGGTSGNTQKIVSLRYDCDGDTLLVQVVPNGPACHTGAYTCFYRDANGELPEEKLPTADRFAPLSGLEETIAKREAERPEGSYTTYLFEKGLDKILKKIGEETAEVIIGGKNEDKQEIRSEAADLIFHLMVLLRQQRIPFDDVLAELEFRHRKPTKKN
ncbi:bifunctional phosphoribosyl-AMP cyclohydrolase/phosphoribosyl-ATP diphosphatase HisIE [Cohnella sp. AR92]|uniref:bifunctional phosphoribosyl-AMP cyclohydrolase/phosphoribosyl-ATP diphosphatase HisIE n=1 Tax=Cohnella sp. AR92 TaxID=648716 RepID=UPI000F8C39D7|nr:bifunctional phosphoribosyl-AMP cyclohydrolase/phosphoribosyl-ATP diphosphatase HisIE [Cohnella sp. AR92]RUS45634.1 bifunctional phosphoribosyl-AMP cyclohydrolase/phosphoribosyl-ATP diphosphatase HisIE [Cohnella sp. AR92]